MNTGNDPVLIRGGISIDERGSVSYVNDFSFEGVKRSYMIRNHRQGFIRGWHGHKREGKYFTVVKGAALLCGVKVDDWENPSKDLKVHKFTLSETAPAVLYLPPGYANAAMNLTADAQILVFSTTTLQESLNDDLRYPSHYWDPWTISE